MRLYEIKIAVLTNYYRKCIYTGKTITINGFRHKEIDIDHIFSIPRKGRPAEEFRENHLDALESIYNLRPLFHINHIENNCIIDYKSSLRWTREEFLLFSDLLKNPKYNDLKLLNFYKDINIFHDLVMDGFKEVEIEIPDWWPQN